MVHFVTGTSSYVQLRSISTIFLKFTAMQIYGLHNVRAGYKLYRALVMSSASVIYWWSCSLQMEASSACMVMSIATYLTLLLPIYVMGLVTFTLFAVLMSHDAWANWLIANLARAVRITWAWAWAWAWAQHDRLGVAIEWRSFFTSGEIKVNTKDGL